MFSWLIEFIIRSVSIPAEASRFKSLKPIQPCRRCVAELPINGRELVVGSVNAEAPDSLPTGWMMAGAVWVKPVLSW
jgi:hypothetical protein